MSAPTRQEAAAYRAAAAGTLDALRGAIMARMAVVAAAFWTLSTKSGTQRAPQVIDSWLPPMATAADERFPYLIVRPKTGTDSEQGGTQNATAEVDIIIGTFSDTYDGGRDVLQLIDAIRENLAAAPTIAETAYEHTGPLAWQLLAPADPLTSTRPQWFGVITTNWTLPRPRRVEARNPTEE